jgi:bacterial/archaeal transporter family-2 protein
VLANAATPIKAAIPIPDIGRAGFGFPRDLIVVGQMLCSLALDHFGILGLPQHAASPARLLGAGLLVLGVMLVRL